MKTTDYAGINYAGFTNTNRNPETLIRYGVIPHHAIGQAWYDESEPYYGKPDEFVCPECDESTALNRKGDAETNWGDGVQCPACGESNEIEFPDMMEPLSHCVDNADISAEQGDDVDIFVMRSKYFTYAQFCSPCAPGACYLLNPLLGEKFIVTDGDVARGNNICPDTGKPLSAGNYRARPSADNRAYCFGHDWFEDGKAPYPVYSVETGELVHP